MTILNPRLWPETEWRPVSDRLDRLDDDQCRQFARRLASAIVETVIDEDPERSELSNADTGERRVEEIEQALDERAWNAQDAEDEFEYARWFRKARAASTVIASRLHDPREAAARTLYDARHALEDDARLRDIIQDTERP